MKLVIIGLFALLALFDNVLAEKVSYKNYTVYKIIPKNKEALKALQDLENGSSDFSRYQFWSGPTRVGQEASLMVAPELKKDIESMQKTLDVDVKIMIEDVQEKIDAENPRTLATRAVDWIAYNTLDEINAWLEQLAVDYPDHITVLRPGQTHQGRDIVGVRFDLTPNNVEKQVVFMESNIHAREWITAATTTWILNEFVTAGPTEVDVLQLAAKYTWYFFPVMNPDGYAYSWETDRMWRKTRTRYNIFCYGADPNRNWGYRWMTGGSSVNPCSDLYAGPRPFSEPSVNVMHEFITNLAETRDMVAYLDFHSFSQMLLLPYGHTTDPLGNYDEMMEIGRVALSKLQVPYGTVYTIGNIAETIYIATGSSMDWVKGTFNTPIAYTYELRDRGENGFLLPPEQILPTARETLLSVISIFEEYEDRHPADTAE